MIRVLIIDDSSVIREHLQHILNSEPGFEIVGVATDGKQGVELAQQTRPDVITMDLNMPTQNGIEATRRIMESMPAPIVVVSSNWSPHRMGMTFEAMEAGAVAMLETPLGIGHPHYDESASEFVRTIRQMATLPVTKRGLANWKEIGTAAAVPKVMPAAVISLAAIGASIGGPPALHAILMRLDKNYRLPVVICQHIAPGFLKGLADWLTETTGFQIRIAKHGEFLIPGRGYIAPDDSQMGVDSAQRITLTDCEKENGVRPSVTYLFRSVGKAYGPRAVGILLSGMGTDGAAGLKAMRDSGAVTIAQERDSCVVNGMPAEAIRHGAAMYVLEPAGIAEMLNALAVPRVHGIT